MSDVQQNLEEIVKKLKLENDENKINSIESAIKDAAIEEYKTMMNGDKLISTITEWREYRLFLLIKNVKKEEILNDKNVSRIFQISESSARNLLRNVMIKYGSDSIIEGVKIKIIKDILEQHNINDADAEYNFVCRSQIVIDWLNEMLEEKPTIDRIAKRQRSVSNYYMNRDAYLEIQRQLKEKENNKDNK